jgi:DMSO/TMAO reductase YedYZ molybdopterin-dependent catalytic subunit
MSTATFKGVLLCDVLAAAGFDVKGMRSAVEDNVSGPTGAVEHVWMEGMDPPYDASIDIERACNPRKDVILAYEMNGVELPPEHGFPIKSVIPGMVLNACIALH